MGVFFHFKTPIAVPDLQDLGTGPGGAQCSPIEPIGEVETLAVQIGDGEVSHVEVTHRPAGGVGHIPPFFGPYSKEGDLIAVPLAIGRLEMAGIVPPLGLEGGMIEVISRKLKFVAGPGPAVFSSLDSDEKADQKQQ